MCAIGRGEWLLLEEEEEEPSTGDNSNRTTTTTPVAADDDNAAATTAAAAAADDDSSLARYLITNIDQQAIRDDFLQDLEDKKITEETIRDIVGRHKHGKQAAAITTLRKNLKGWAERPSNLHRKYHWYSVAQLKHRIKEIDARLKPVGNKEAVLQALVDCEIKQTERNEAIANGEVSR